MVTGASGFIGKHLVQKLLEKGYKVLAFDKRQENLKTEFIQGNVVSFNFSRILKDVELVFHLAGLLGTTELFHRIIEAERVNVLGTLNLLESIRKSNVKKVVFTSKPNIWKHNVYTITKENCERYLEMYQEIYGLRVVITRPFNVYGPGQTIKEYRKAIPYFIVAALRNEPIEIFDDGNQTIDPIYVDDVVEALILCGEKLPEEIVEIGCSKPIKVKDLAKKIIRLVGSHSKIFHRPMRKGETYQSTCANGNMVRLIGFKPKVKLEEGLKRTINWYKEHLNEFKKICRYKDEDFFMNC